MGKRVATVVDSTRASFGARRRPVSLIERAVARLTYRIDNSEGVREAAQVLETGVPALLRHLTNTGFITENDRERIEEEIVSASDPA